ncbi:Vesicle transport protein SFT2B [Portunus trituberculatus]|uniref:Vesicle transport protein n=1 Tax=Portunus trituberculatus TaxID=210409 RepID=A0A5B7ESR9_PORTR|nr:Vesicle transport protein SFT2B [Portunus trituberculatus]
MVVIDNNSLSWSTRVKGFAICFILGFVMSFLGSALLFLPKGLVLFAVLYTFGNILALSRIFKTKFYDIPLIINIYRQPPLNEGIHKKALALLMVIIQFLAMTWYSLSYIPYARDAAKKCFASCVE